MTIDVTRIELDTSNPEPRCPCVLLLDTSQSMSGSPIEEVNAGLREFCRSLQEDDLAMLRVEVAVVTFGGTPTVVQDFTTAHQFQAPTLRAIGNTPMGAAIQMALNLLNVRKESYIRNGLSYFRPWVFLVTDGAPTDGDTWRVAAQRVQQAEDNKKVAFFAVGVGAKADMSVLRQIGRRQPVSLKGLNFKEMFLWLSSSLIRVSRSKPGDEIPPQRPMEWVNS